MLQQFREVVGVFHQLKDTASRNDKEAILQANKDNELFRYILDFIYNPYILTGIRFKKLVKFADFTSEDVPQFRHVVEAIEYLKANNSGRDKDVQAIANFINTYDTDIYSPVHDFLQEMFTKDFKCGVTASTINKVLGKNFIPKFDVMLAEKWVEQQDKVEEDFLITEKLDGVRCVIIKENGNVSMFTRKGMPIEGLVEIEEEVKNAILDDNIVLDGELLNINVDNVDSKALFRQTTKRIKKEGIKKDVEFHAFDFLPVSEFKAGKSTNRAYLRKSLLNEMIDFLDLKHIKAVPVLYIGDDKSRVEEILEEVIAKGKEGIMVNLARGLYEAKRSKQLLKVKKFKSFEDFVVGVYEGEKKNKGKLGGVLIKFKDLVVKVGSGFTDEERESYWKNPDLVVGKLAECQYFEESENQDGGKDLRFATWKGLRFDKDEPHYD